MNRLTELEKDLRTSLKVIYMLYSEMLESKVWQKDDSILLSAESHLKKIGRKIYSPDMDVVYDKAKWQEFKKILKKSNIDI